MRHLLATTIAALVLVSLALSATAAEPFRYMGAQELERTITAHEPVILFDIQVEEEFAKQHIKGAKPTYAYPAKSAEDKAKLDASLGEVTNSTAPVVIVCPRGAGAAERTYEYLQERGIASKRLYILEKGQAGWSCAELTERK